MSLEGNVGAAEVLRGRINLCDLLVISAYAIAVKHGFEGTEEEWLESLRGEDGISSIYILDEGESLEQVPDESAIVIDPFGEGGAGDGITLLLDETLTRRGYAADAKAVGDRLGKIEAALDAINGKVVTGYSYNGNVLPALPEWDKETYPYAVIWSSPVMGTTWTYFDVAKSFVYRDEEDGSRTFGYSECMTCRLKADKSGWDDLVVSEISPYWVGPTDSEKFLWTNTDILNADGTVALKASEPVAVYE